LRDGDIVIEEVDLWPQPAYYDKSTSRGTPMKYVITARPQRLNVFTSNFCHFWPTTRVADSATSSRT